MKILKKLFFACAMTCLALVIGLGVSSFNHGEESSSAAVISNETFNYISLSQNGQSIKTKNIKNYQNTSYVISNGSTTITLKPLEYAYEFGSLTNFIETSSEITINFDETEQKFPETFEYKGLTYYYKISSSILSIYKNAPSSSKPITSSNRNQVISYVKLDNDSSNTDSVGDQIKIKIIESYTLKSNVDTSNFIFSVNPASIIKSYTLVFVQPVIQFANAQEPIVRFTGKGLDAGASDYVENNIPNDLTFNSLQIDFLNNNYTEYNPLFFNINQNGFTYEFELYTKEYQSHQYLFVNYKDAKKVEYIATGLYLDGSGQLQLDLTQTVDAFISTDSNEFSLNFIETGRYSIEIYDSTYLYGFENANYMQTSFYITDPTKTNFENIYIIAQSLNDSGNEREYIVSTSDQNYSVKTTIKNLHAYKTNGTDPSVTLADIVDKIEVRKIAFGGSNNVPTITTYSVNQVENLMNPNGDFVLTFEDDAYYEIEVFDKNSDQTKYYQFTIVKLAKTTFTVPVVDKNGDPVFDPTTGHQKTETFALSSSEKYKTVKKNYIKNIISSMNLEYKFTDSDSGFELIELGKVYTNKYTISYGIEAVSMEKYELIGDDDKPAEGLHLKFYGVGNIKVEVTVNGNTTAYDLNSEKNRNTLSFTEYGTYTVRMVDSMGTETVQVFKYSKKLNFSAMAIIILSSIIVLAVVLFVLKARGKVATR